MPGEVKLSERTRLSFGDLQRAFPDESGKPLTRGVLDRLLRDYGRDIPGPEFVGGARIWPVEAIDTLRVVIQRDRERRR